MRQIIYLIFVFVLITSISAQKISRDISNYKFIKTEKNRLEIPENGDSALINRFFAKLDSLQRTRNGKINIVHIGGSHVQAGWFSNKIRDNFGFFNDTLCPPAGIIFPFRAAKTNNPPHYSVSCTGEWTATRNVLRKNYDIALGISGIAIETTDATASITVRMNADSISRVCRFDTIILLGKNYGAGVLQPVILLDNSEVVKPLTDSISDYYTFALPAPAPADAFTLAFQTENTGNFKFAVNGFIPKNSSQGVSYHALGVNGAAVPSYLNCENFERELTLVKPDLMIFGIGINDAVDANFDPEKFINNYNLLLDKIRRVSPDCAFIFITNNDSYRRVRLRKRRYRYDVNKNGQKVEQAFYNIAEQNAGAVWNQFGIMGGLRSMQDWEKAGLAAKDKIHFTKAGYQILGDLMFDAIIMYNEKLKIENE